MVDILIIICYYYNITNFFKKVRSETMKCNLSTLMGSKKMSIQDVCDKTGLSRNTVAFLYHEKVKRIDFETITKLCDLFNCNTQELLEYTPITSQ